MTTPEDQGPRHIFRPYDLPNPSTPASFNNPLNISTVDDGLQNKTLQPHQQRNEWVTGCLACGKSYDQVIQKTVADYLNQTAQPGETVRERQIKRNIFIDGIQSEVFTFLPPAACDVRIYSVNYNGQNSGMQGYALPLYED